MDFCKIYNLYITLYKIQIAECLVANNYRILESFAKENVCGFESWCIHEHFLVLFLINQSLKSSTESLNLRMFSRE